MRLFTCAAIILSLATGVASAADRKTGWAEDGLKGKVRSVRAVSTTIGKTADTSSRTSRYDKAGSRLEWARYDAAGKLKDRTTYAYTQKGALAELVYYGQKNALQTRSAYTYNEKGERTEITNYDAKAAVKDKTTSTYDPKGRETGATRVGAAGAIRERVAYTPDAKGRVTEESRFDGAGALVSKLVTIYDDHDYPAKQSTYDGSGTMTARESWTNDDDGNKVDWTIDNPDGTVKEKWQYDYSFDKQGNWTKRTASKVVEKFGKPSTVPTYVTTRTIEYF